MTGDPNDERPKPILHRREDGHISIDWGTPNNELPSWPILVVPELIVEMVNSHNARVREVARFGLSSPVRE